MTLMGWVVSWMERAQVPLYLAALAVGAGIGLLIPAAATPAGFAITPALGLLLYATFLAVPFTGLTRALRDWRFLVTVLVVNFAVVPLIVWPLTRIVAHDQVLLVGVLMVLLTPCIDYVIAFTGLAGGAKGRLLAATPLLMLAQIVLLPLYLRLFVGAEFAQTIDAGPFIHAFLLLIALPLALAWLTQLAAIHTVWGARVRDTMLGAMVPLMMITLAIVVTSQISGIGARLGSLLLVIPVYVLFAAIMFPLGAIAGRAARLEPASTRAVMFSGATRNSLVVLPLTLALPAAFNLVPLVVVTQTLVELVAMVVTVRVLRHRSATRA